MDKGEGEKKDGSKRARKFERKRMGREKGRKNKGTNSNKPGAHLTS
jgi:hypothetical protein